MPTEYKALKHVLLCWGVLLGFVRELLFKRELQLKKGYLKKIFFEQNHWEIE